MRISAVILLTIIISCTAERKPAGEVAGENYTIQVMPLQMDGDDRGTLEYKVRVLPRQNVLDEQGKQLQERLWYRTDSCFYIMQGNTHIKPELVQPIATGMVNCYEFMLAFDGLSASGDNELTLVFDDRHITKEKYLIELNRRYN